MPSANAAIPKVVFDCNVFLQALVNPVGAAGLCKALVDHGHLELFVSEEVLTEVAEVLCRPFVKKLAPALTLEIIEAFIADIRLNSICLQNVPEEFRFERDPKDECYINLAIVAGAKFIVSRDNDLLDLMKADNKIASSFQQRYPMLKIIQPAELLAEIERQ